MGRRKPSADEPLHTLPLDASLLAPPFERVMPEVTDREAEVSQCVPVSRYSEVSDMPTHNGLQPLADFRKRGSLQYHVPLLPPTTPYYLGVVTHLARPNA